MFKLRISLYCIFSAFILISCQNKNAKPKVTLNPTDSFYSSGKTYSSFSKNFTDSIHTFFNQNFDGVVLFYKNGKLYTDAYGFSDYSRSSRIDKDDIFQLASVSKTVTSVATLILVQENKIGLDSLLNHYLPDFPYPKITVRQLLSHRSGLPNYMYHTDTFWKDTSRYMNNTDLYRFMVNTHPEPNLEPGVCFDYCNTNFALLAVLVEKISGLPFNRFVEEKIFKPCGMRNSFYLGHKPARIKNRVLTGRFEKYVYNSTYYLDGVLGDKSLFSCANDLFLFHMALSEGRLLKPVLLNAMQTPSYEFNVYGGSYGLGFRLMNTPHGQWTYHNGWWRGFWTFFWNRFDKKACFVILTNNKRSSHIDKLGIAECLLNAR